MQLKEIAESEEASFGKTSVMERTRSKTLGNHKKMEE